MYTYEYPDEVIKELWNIKEEHAAKFNYDLEAIFRDLKERQEKSGRVVVSFAPKKTEEIEIEEISLAKASRRFSSPLD